MGTFLPSKNGHRLKSTIEPKREDSIGNLYTLIYDETSIHRGEFHSRHPFSNPGKFVQDEWSCLSIFTPPSPSWRFILVNLVFGTLRLICQPLVQICLAVLNPIMSSIVLVCAIFVLSFCLWTRSLLFRSTYWGLWRWRDMSFSIMDRLLKVSLRLC